MEEKGTYCPNCGKKMTDDGTFCSKCGTNIHNYDPLLKKTKTKNNNNDLLKGIIVGVCLIIIVISLIVIAGSIGNITSNSGLIVENVSVTDDIIGQKITADILPDKDYDYLGATIVYYDANGAVLKTNSILWNMPDVHKGQPIKMQGESYSYDYAGKPASAKILFFDSALTQKEDDALFVYTINYNQK